MMLTFSFALIYSYFNLEVDFQILLLNFKRITYFIFMFNIGIILYIATYKLVSYFILSYGFKESEKMPDYTQLEISAHWIVEINGK